MKILGMPGVNPQTGPWMDNILGGVASAGDRAQTQHYGFWTSGEERVDAAAELQIVSSFDPELIVAKSMGTLLTLRGVSDGMLQPKQCVLIGIPVAGSGAGIDLLLRWHELNLPTLFIQQELDRTGTFEQLSALVNPESRCTLVAVPGSDHVYADTAVLIKLINDWRET